MKLYNISSGFGSKGGKLLVVNTDNWLTEAGFERDAEVLAQFLRQVVPGGTLDRVWGAIDRQRREHAERIKREQEQAQAYRKRIYEAHTHVPGRNRSALFNWVQMGYQLHDNENGTWSFVPFREEVEIYD